MRKFIVACLALVVCLGLVLVTQAAAKMGTVKVADKNMALEVTLSGIKKPIMVNSKGAAFPEGQHSVKDMAVLLRDSSGKTWRMEMGSEGKWSVIDVKAGETTELAPKFPITLRVSSRQYVATGTGMAAGQKTVAIGFGMYGDDKEYYLPRVLMGQQPVPAPSFKITDEQGQLLHTGKFEFG